MNKLASIVKKIVSTLPIFGALALPLLIATPALAAECGTTKTFFDWGCSGGDENIIMNVLVVILNWLAVGVAVAAVIGVLYGAVIYASAGGNEAQTKKAIGIIRNTVIAIVLYFAMYSILQFIIPGGLFN